MVVTLVLRGLLGLGRWGGEGELLEFQTNKRSTEMSATGKQLGPISTGVNIFPGVNPIKGAVGCRNVFACRSDKQITCVGTRSFVFSV